MSFQPPESMDPPWTSAYLSDNHLERERYWRYWCNRYEEKSLRWRTAFYVLLLVSSVTFCLMAKGGAS